MKQASASYHYTGLTGKGATTAQNQPNGKKKSSSKRRKKKKTNADGMSALGCLGRTIVFTLVLFAAVIMSRELIILDEIQECPKTLMSFLERGIPMSV
jgi:hypothetical protein